jgi:hypothetical protein
MKKTAVLFPGIGYTCKRPLLHYSSQMTRLHGYETIELDYGADIHSIAARDEASMLAVCGTVLERILPQLRGADLGSSDDVIFISKSIGTYIAWQCMQKLEIHVRHFMMTPIAPMLEHIDCIDGIFLSGTADPLVPSDAVYKAEAACPGKAAMICPDCDHSLENRRDPLGNIKRLYDIEVLLEKNLR